MKKLRHNYIQNKIVNENKEVCVVPRALYSTVKSVFKKSKLFSNITLAMKRTKISEKKKQRRKESIMIDFTRKLFA